MTSDRWRIAARPRLAAYSHCTFKPPTQKARCPLRRGGCAVRKLLIREVSRLGSKRMAYIGYEPERETLKYRCPAKHEGWETPMSKICNAGKSCCKTVRVDREEVSC